jgi:hypothetical protein
MGYNITPQKPIKGLMGDDRVSFNFNRPLSTCNHFLRKVTIIHFSSIKNALSLHLFPFLLQFSSEKSFAFNVIRSLKLLDKKDIIKNKKLWFGVNRFVKNFWM